MPRYLNYKYTYYEMPSKGSSFLVGAIIGIIFGVIIVITNAILVAIVII